MYNNSSTIGNIGEAVAISEFTKRKIPVLIPFGQNTPYDLVIQYKNRFYKVQCKTTEKVLGNSTMRFHTCRTNGFTGQRHKYCENEIDLFFLYCIENGYIGLLKIDDTTGDEFAIRLAATKNNQTKGIHMATDYDLDNVLLTL